MWHPGVWWHPIGFFVVALATTAIVIAVTNDDDDEKQYHYDNGTYYTETNQNGQKGYQVVPAPIGARVPALPDGYTSIQLGSEDYYYYSGAFYLEDTDQQHYVVVQAPQGAVIPYLPDGNEKTTVNGIQYYLYDGIYYQAKSANGQVTYEVVAHP